MFTTSFIRRSARIQLLTLCVEVCMLLAPLLLMPDIASAQAAGGCPQGQVAYQRIGGTICVPESKFAVSCEGWRFMTSPLICTTRTISAFFSGVFVKMATWVLSLAGTTFNWVLDKTVIQFGSFVNTSIQNVINAVWTAFRDISNILIIGLFVFIAISMILGRTGSEQFGARRMIARVLIVAVLINFSLLFSKVIIDFSNFTAVQIYQAASASGVLPQYNSSGQQQQQQGAGAAAGTYGIAGAFMDFAGVSGLWDTYDATRKAADKLDDAGLAFVHGLFTAIMLFVAAIALFYGTFLLIVRGVLLIFLMMTSSIAFASYLFPKFASGSFGWSAWWSALIRNAVFAPLLMLLLWATLIVGQQARQFNTGGGTLGDLLSNPTKTADMSSLFIYLIVIGLLIIAIRISSQFSAKIGGFDWASTVTALPITFGGKLAGIAGRQAVGRLEDRRSKALSGDIREAARNQALRPSPENLSKLNSLVAQKANADTNARRSFNFMNSGAAQALAKGLGVGGFTGKDAKPHGFANAPGRAAAAAQKQAQEKAVNTALASARKDLKQEDADKRAAAARAAAGAPPAPKTTPPGGGTGGKTPPTGGGPSAPKVVPPGGGAKPPATPTPSGPKPPATPPTTPSGPKPPTTPPTTPPTPGGPKPTGGGVPPPRAAVLVEVPVLPKSKTEGAPAGGGGAGKGGGDAEKAVKQAAEAATQAQAQERARREVESNENNRNARENLRLQREAVNKQGEVAKKTVEAQRDQLNKLGSELKTLNTNARAAEDKKTVMIKDFEEGRISEERHRQQMKEQDEHIKQAKALVKAVQEKVDEINVPVTEADRELQRVEKEERELDSKLDRETRVRAGEILSDMQKTTQAMQESATTAKQAQKQLADFMPKTVTESTENTTVIKMTKDQLRQQGNKRLADIFRTPPQKQAGNDNNPSSSSNKAA